MTENDLIGLYCIVDDFFQRFVETKAGKKHIGEYYGKRGPRRQLSVPEVMTLSLVRILDRTGDLKTFHKNACVHYRRYFPSMPNYENFLKATNKATGFIAAFFQAQLYLIGRKPCAAARKNMRRLMTKEQCQLLRNRNIIENVWSVLKLNYNLIYHRARSVVGMFRHFFFSISAFLFYRVYEKHNFSLQNTTFCGKLDF